MIRKCLIVDNDNQEAEIDKLTRIGKLKGFDIECLQFNVGSTFEDELLTEGKIDIQKVIIAYNQRFKKQVFHIAAFDWDLSDKTINGLELIRQFEHYRLLRNTSKILYTGSLQDKLSNMLDEFKNESISKSTLLDHLKALIKIDIKGFFERDNYEQEILTVLSSTDETIDFIIEDELRKHPSLKFVYSFASKQFKGKTFVDIADILEREGGLRNEFKREIIQQVIAYMTEKF